MNIARFVFRWIIFPVQFFLIIPLVLLAIGMATRSGYLFYETGNSYKEGVLYREIPSPGGDKVLVITESCCKSLLFLGKYTVLYAIRDKGDELAETYSMFPLTFGINSKYVFLESLKGGGKNIRWLNDSEVIVPLPSSITYLQGFKNNVKITYEK